MCLARHVDPTNGFAGKESGTIVAQPLHEVVAAHDSFPCRIVDNCSRRCTSAALSARVALLFCALSDAFRISANPQPAVRFAEKPYVVSKLLRPFRRRESASDGFAPFCFA